MTNKPAKDKTKFEKDLETYFPEIHRLHNYSKFDKLIWEVADALIEMADQNAYGELRITYQSGRINHIFQTKNRNNTDKTKLPDT